MTVVGTTAGRLVAFDADGQRLWQADTTEVPIRHPFVRLDQTTMVATFVDGRVAAYDLRTGAVRWENHVQADLQLPPVVADGRVIVVTPDVT
ncbi:MAG: PQQ-binding-like beta-propeller repeat protein [Micropruina sp.]|nr:MAG: PQQ-binding-like beta-propeller repeat protein [Micropruina sp.]